MGFSAKGVSVEPEELMMGVQTSGKVAMWVPKQKNVEILLDLTSILGMYCGNINFKGSMKTDILFLMHLDVV